MRSLRDEGCALHDQLALSRKFQGPGRRFVPNKVENEHFPRLTSLSRRFFCRILTGDVTSGSDASDTSSDSPSEPIRGCSCNTPMYSNTKKRGMRKEGNRYNHHSIGQITNQSIRPAGRGERPRERGQNTNPLTSGGGFAIAIVLKLRHGNQ